MKFDFAVEVFFKPGVTHNVGRTATQAVKDIFPSFQGTVFSSKQYLLSGINSSGEAHKLVSTLLANDLIEAWSVKNWVEFKQSEGFSANPPLAGSNRRGNKPAREQRPARENKRTKAPRAFALRNAGAQEKVFPKNLFAKKKEIRLERKHY